MREEKMKPVIGVTSSLKEEQTVTSGMDYYNSACRAGGLPVILPNLQDEDAVEQYAQLIDGLIVSGGVDIDPEQYGEEPSPALGQISPKRDFFEIKLVQSMLKLDKPILGLCRGCQVLNVALGGDLFQDIYDQHEHKLLQHRQKAPRDYATHYIEIERGSKLHEIVQHDRIKVNSFHHQAVRNVGKHLRVSARSSDGIIEAIESETHRFVIGTQWHPENLFRGDDIHAKKLFEAFIHACAVKS